MRMVLLGAPGAGKGTQAVKISERLGIPHISTGDIFRFNIKNNTELGQKVKDYLNKGLLVPDELTIEIVKDRLQKDDCKDGFLLDGFPRTIFQAEALDKYLDSEGLKIDMVLNINVDDQVVVKRLSGRRVCPNCNAGYHIEHSPTRIQGICDNCGAKLIQRDDDKEETIIDRLKTYHAQTAPLENYYKNMDLVKDIDSSGTIERTTKEAIKVLGV